MALFIGWAAWSGCASTPTRYATPIEMAQELRAVGVDNPIIPYTLTNEMRAWLEDHVPQGSDPELKLRRLIDNMIGDKGLAVNYVAGYTGTAAEVFASNQGNCLSFTHLFVGMARELGLPVRFLEVRDVESFTREGDLVVVSDHIAVGLGPPHEMQIIDFGEDRGGQYAKVSLLEDRQAVAMYYSNKGAEALRGGVPEAAVRWLNDATRIAPDVHGAWINLGVARRRTGDLEGAERAYRRALEADSQASSAYANLSTLLRLQGREEEALGLLSLADRSSNRNPFSYIALGDLSLRYGRFGEAERFYRRAVRLDPSQSDAIASLGLLAIEVERPRIANKLLKRALKVDPDGDRVATLIRRLGKGDSTSPARGAESPSG